MAAQRPSRLGRGLDGLFASSAPVQERVDETKPEEATAEVGARLLEIPLDEISPNPQQPRTNFDEDDLAELTESVREFGVLQPIVVRELGKDRYELIMGERRLRASRAAGVATIPAIARDTADDNMLRDALIENVHRSDLNPIEEAMAYTQLLDDFGCTKEELSQRIHRSRPVISNTLRLLNLPTKVQSKVAAGVLSAGHARALLGLPDAASQEALATRIIAEGLSVRATEEIVAMHDANAPVRTPRAPRVASHQEREIASHLSDHFDTRVKVNIGRNKGRITIEFATGEDLERIMTIINGHKTNRAIHR